MISLRALLVRGFLRLAVKGRAERHGGIDEQRQGFRRLTDLSLWGSPAHSVREVDADGVPSLWLTSPDAESSDRVILYFHGGGYAFGSMHSHRSLAAWLARRCRARVLLPDYRLAPEHRFPRALDDALIAHRWLLRQPGVSPGRLAMGGDSAGGGLTLAALHRLRDEGAPLPSAAFVISPWADLTLAAESLARLAAADPFMTVGTLRACLDHYAPALDARDPAISPLFADFRGLPPLLVQVGSDEILRDDAHGVATRARLAGVAVDLQEFRRMFHVFQAVPFLPETREAVSSIGDFMDRHW